MYSVFKDQSTTQLDITRSALNADQCLPCEAGGSITLDIYSVKRKRSFYYIFSYQFIDMRFKPIDSMGFTP